MKTNTSMRTVLCLAACIVLALALTLTGCSSAAAPETTAPPETTAAPETAAAPVETEAAEEAVTFTVEVTDKDGNTTTYPISTDCATVGEALLAEGLIAGEESEYGLYVTTVDGTTLDWDTDAMYWAFYIDGEYATTGVDATEVTPGAVYAFVATQG